MGRTVVCSKMYPRHNTGHYFVLGCLCGVILREHQHYLRLRTRLPLYSPKQLAHEDSIFASILKSVPKTPGQECVHASWISEETWRVISTRLSL